ncbi:hypothetical protein [uncultured Tateyamaria sp.]|uniref:hypothetical protein n=1 Tax=uncultured Tateyamaria sp. TaxID=455651 RepID=UPI0026294BAB|nr:hypothetical protein [uncultured Tateyamaria sp.]
MQEERDDARLHKTSDAKAIAAHAKPWLKPTQISTLVACLLGLWFIFGERFQLFFDGKLHFSELDTTGVRDLTGWIMLVCLITGVFICVYAVLAPRRIAIQGSDVSVEDAIGRPQLYSIQDVNRVKGRPWRNEVLWYIWVSKRRPIKVWKPAWQNERPLVKALFAVRPDLATDENRKLLSKGK